MEPLIEAWRKNNRLNLFLLGHLSEEQLALELPKSKSIRGHLAHIVNVRRMKLKMCARDLLDSDGKIDRHHATAEELREGLVSSGVAVERLLARAENPSGKVKNAPGTVSDFLASLLAHEGNHRGQVEATLRLAGQELSPAVQLALWDWAKA